MNHTTTIDGKLQPGFPAAPELGLTLTRILKNPLAALRASMERLAKDLPTDGPHSAQVQSALDEVARLSRTVQDLVDFAAPRELKPLTCATDELLFSTLRMLPEGGRSRVRLARSDFAEQLRVDGPQLCLALRHLADYVLATSGGEVIFGARLERDCVLFTLVGAALEGATHPSIQLDLGLHLASRDIPRMGGALTLQRSARGATCVQVSFPRLRRGGNAA